MILTKANITELKKVTVKIHCPNDEEGSGIVMCSKGENYVLTAAHVIEHSGTDGHWEIGRIIVSMIRNNMPFNFTVDSVVLYDKAKDTAVMRVRQVESEPLNGLDRIKILTSNVNGIATFGGIRREEKTPKHYSFENRGVETWAIANVNLSTQLLPPKTNFEGSSGGGVFYQDDEKNLYLVAFMSSLERYDGTNNEFNCKPASYFNASHLFDNLIDSREYEYSQSDSEMSKLNRDKCLKELDHSGYDKNQRGIFLENEKTKAILTKLRDDEEMTIVLTAMSGMGKSKLIYEAFRQTETLRNRYYAKYDDNHKQIINEAEQILRKCYEEDGIIIVDDWPVEYISELINTRDNCNSEFRLIMANHDFFNDELATPRDYSIIKLQPNEMEERVNQYISSEIGEDENKKNDISEIKKLSGGYPQMAIELVKAYKNSNTASPQTVASLMPKLLNLTVGSEKEEEKVVWQTLSLCMPFPYRDATHDGFKFMISNNNVTQLKGMVFEERRSLTAKIVGKYSPTLIDKIGEWLYVRPFPLAVWLTAEWFKNVCNTSAHFTELIEDIKKQPQSVQDAISEGFCKHIQQMSGNKEAFEMVGRLVNSDINNPFFNEETLRSGLGSKLFLAMSTVNPTVIAKCLRNVLGYKDINWLREHFDGDGRRHIVWALERLCFAHESYHDGVYMMARLAVAENENTISNNATGQLIQLFHYALAGTEVDLKVRLQTLKDLVNESDEYIPILVRCFDAALQNRSFFRMRGAEKFGFENRKDYAPKTWDEVYNYWHGCRDILLEWMDKKPVVVEKVAEIVEGNVYHWASGGQKDVLVPLLEKIAEKKDYRWDKGYEALAQIVYSYGIDGNELGITDLMEKLNSGTFVTKLNDARYKYQRRNHLSDEENMDLSEVLFSPLAKDFWNDKIYLKTEDVETLLENTEYIPIDFVKYLVENASDEQLNCFFDVIIGVLKSKPEAFNSHLLRNISFYSKDRKPLMSFLDKIRECGMENIYISLMAGTEDDNLGHFEQLVSEQKNLKLDFLPIYLQSFRSYGNERYLMMLKRLRENFPNRPNDLISFVLNERFMISKDDCPESVDIVKKALLEFNVEGENGRMLNDYTRILVKTLQYCHDEEFAKQVNSKFIKVYNTKIVHLNMKGIFTALLKDYAKEVLPDFINAFLGEDTFLFYYQVKDELGSGFGFGNGPLFDLDENLIKQICMQHPDSAPTRIATMVPCYDLDTNGKITDKFNKWVIWLLDNFGEQKEVRSNISANIGTFSWTGDLSLYYERNIKCFEQLLNHNKQEVKDWAKECISYQKKLFDKEKKDETYRNICSEL
ncbi:MAG: trypsin-like peptidase domain-containing protein [Paludibacteraceae bacterium]|nr:trypsin-like peptidase domain-containing protein [Paludibacteraceae bacterium]